MRSQFGHFSSDSPESTALTIAPSNTTVLKGSMVTFNCSADANPAANYTLYHNGVMLGSNMSGIFIVMVMTSGGYTCVPENSVGIGENDTVDISVVGNYEYTG